MGNAIEAEGLHKRYGEHQALRGVDLAVPAGSLLGVLGPNGAGKTTTVRVLTTLLEADSGRAVVAGHDVRTHPREVRRRIGLTGQYAALDELLTGRENLHLVGRLHRMGTGAAKAAAGDLLDRLDLGDAADRPVKTYSGGMRRRLDLAACLIAGPEVLFLDEPTTGLDLTSRLTLWDMIRDQLAQGVTVLMTTQYLEEADQLADRISVIDGGRVIAEGTPDELKGKVGGERLEVTVADPADVPEAVRALRAAAAAEPSVGQDGRTVGAPLSRGMESVSEAAAALHTAGVRPVEFAVRRPSLDDVFLALTGGSTREGGEPTP
ncbi:ATP-binding cassette domain-containing protein [Streptomyces sp. SCUT-3]|uniref:ATP-binding cassette domain-containing protein n=1 Tax=Streptomyces TaxID=1883 RepID=UPI000CAAB018|nr:MULTISPECIES: ATP-binding cassette domain-containing protein [unclassified Streptomyces]MCZ2527828.1 ATP-binding cassette domain-containing protein [Streptomyces sp. HB2AG]PLW69304.1 daunorubicin/doxorubicin resistance ABC transporter ATP-binding protein DrrA [Streptomyces sp. DJ]QMV22165.1 ATP-binding cassette domain-containing protein [Streptomyces sp. SCUT-3]